MLVTVFVARATFLHYAESKADEIIANARGESVNETVINIARYASKRFVVKGKPYRLLAYEYYFYSRHLPSFIRLPKGSLDVVFQEGQCNAAANLLLFIYTRMGIKSLQHDIIYASGSGHSALSALVEGCWLFLDPYFGVAFQHHDRLLSLDEVQELVRGG